MSQGSTGYSLTSYAGYTATGGNLNGFIDTTNTLTNNGAWPLLPLTRENLDFSGGTAFTIEFDFFYYAGQTSGALSPYHTAVMNSFPFVTPSGGAFRMGMTYANSAFSGGSQVQSETFTPAADTWYKVAMSFTGTTAYFFLDGALISSVAYTLGTYDFRFQTSNVAMGGYWGTFNTLKGGIDNFRLTRGVARYTASYTPSGKLFYCEDALSLNNGWKSNTANSSLILNFESDLTTDSSSNMPTVLSEFGAVLSTSESKWGTKSADVSLGAIVVTSGININFSGWNHSGTSWTFECWFKHGSTVNSNECIAYAGDYPGGGGARFWAVFWNTSGNLSLFNSNGGVFSTETYNDNQWHYLIVQLDSVNSRFKLYVDGVQIATVARLSDASNPVSLSIGNYLNNGTEGTYFIDAVRVSNVLRFPNTASTTCPVPNV
jgi:hypothetical protein